MKSPHPREEVEYQNVNKGKECYLHVKGNLEVVISDHITDVLLVCLCPPNLMLMYRHTCVFVHVDMQRLL